MKDSTHKNGHNLDLVITRSGDQLVRNVRVSDLVMSDHCAAGLERTSVCFQKIRFIDRDQFVQDIKDLSLKNHQDFRAVSALSGCYDNILRSLFDQYTPVKKSDLLPLGIQIASKRGKQKRES